METQQLPYFVGGGPSKQACMWWGGPASAKAMRRAFGEGVFKRDAGFCQEFAQQQTTATDSEDFVTG